MLQRPGSGMPILQRFLRLAPICSLPPNKIRNIPQLVSRLKSSNLLLLFFLRHRHPRHADEKVNRSAFPFDLPGEQLLCFCASRKRLPASRLVSRSPSGAACQMSCPVNVISFPVFSHPSLPATILLILFSMAWDCRDYGTRGSRDARLRQREIVISHPWPNGHAWSLDSRFFRGCFRGGECQGCSRDGYAMRCSARWSWVVDAQGVVRAWCALCMGVGAEVWGREK